MSKLAILGGEKAVKIPAPHFVWPIIGEDEKQAVMRQLDTGNISINDWSGVIKEFELSFAEYQGMKYALTTNNGTSALLSAYFACNIKEGDEVIAPAYTFLATVTPLLHLGAIPVLCDGLPENGNIDPNEIEAKITNKTKAIVVTHVWGHPCEMDEITKIAKDHNLLLIEDCSHAHGAIYKGQKVGTFGDVSCFSLQGKKILFSGEGGVLVTNNRKIYERAVLYGHYRARTKQCVKDDFLKNYGALGYGLKFRMHPIAATLALVGLEKLDSRIEQRRENLDFFSDLLKNIKGIDPPTTKKYVSRGAYYGYKPLYKPEELGGVSIKMYVKALQAEGVDVHEPGSAPLCNYKLFQNIYSEENKDEWPMRSCFAKSGLKYSAKDFPVTMDYYSRAISLPTFTLPTDKEIIKQYADAFRKVADNYLELLKYEKILYE